MKPSAREEAAYQHAVKAKEDAFLQGALGQSMHGNALLHHETSVRGQIANDVFYAEYQRGWKQRGAV